MHTLINTSVIVLFFHFRVLWHNSVIAAQQQISTPKAWPRPHDMQQCFYSASFKHKTK